VDGWDDPRERNVGGLRLFLVFALVIAAAYANSLSIGYRFDDWHVLEKNPAIRSLSSIPRFFVDPASTTVLPENMDLRPLLMTTFALNYALSGDAPWSWHVVNLLLHWLVVVLVFRIVRDHLWLGAERTAIAAAAALIVAVHPLNTEPVNYLSARSALLTAVFYLGAFDAGARDRWGPCALLFVCALLTKAIAVTLPLALLAHHLVAPRRTAVPWRFLAGLGVLAVAGLAYRTLLVPASTIASARQPGVTWWTYFMTQWSAYLYYVRLFLWPDALVVDRLDYPVAQSFLALRAWGSLVVLLGVAGLAWSVRRRQPALAFAVLWYLVALAAESTIFPLAEPVNEHRPYLGMLGLATAAALVLWQLSALAARRSAAAFTLLVALLTCALATATFARNWTWQDDYALWRDATEKAPQNARAWLNAGHAAMRRGLLDEARRFLLQAHALSPCYAYVQMNLSALAGRTGDAAESLRWADEAVGCNPGLALTHFYRGAALERLARFDEALAAYARTTALDPNHAGAWIGQGGVLERRSAWSEAVAAYDRAFAADPTDAEAAMRGALVRHYRLADAAGAVARYRTVLRLVPTHYGAHYQLAVALLAQGETAEAERAWQAFVPLAEALGDRASLDGAPEALRLSRR
jgi:tetratricopeptide (TPR) repeat protein